MNQLAAGSTEGVPDYSKGAAGLGGLGSKSLSYLVCPLLATPARQDVEIHHGGGNAVARVSAPVKIALDVADAAAVVVAVVQIVPEWGQLC